MDAPERLMKLEAGKKLSIAVVGGGRRCLSLLKMLEPEVPIGPNAEIVGVADVDPSAAGLDYARERGIFTTNDYRRLYDLPGLEMIVNLTGDRSLCRTVADGAPEHITVLPYPASRLFQEIVQNVIETGRRLSSQANELSRAKSFARAMAQATIVGVMILNTDYQIAWINNAALKTAGLTRDEAIGRYCFQVSHQQIAPCGAPDTPCPMKETLETGLAAHAIHDHRLPNGVSTYCDITTYPLFDSEGKVIEVVEVIRDLTDELNEKLDRRTRDFKQDLVRLVQEDKLVSLGKMVASVAHEINNPIGSIINFTTLIKKSLLNGETGAEELRNYDRYLDLTIREAQRCGKIVGGLLSFARQQPIEPKVIDLREMVEKIIVLTRHRMELSNIVLSWGFGDAPLLVWGDFTQIQQCLINLVFNAMEAMPDGGRLMIGGGLDKEAGMVRILISDTGVGISRKNIGQIFEPFFTTKENGYGVGLGLSMVYGIVREHGGDVSVKSQEGLGTTFRVDLPITSRTGVREGGDE